MSGTSRSATSFHQNFETPAPRAVTLGRALSLLPDIVKSIRKSGAGTRNNLFAFGSQSYPTPNSLNPAAQSSNCMQIDQTNSPPVIVLPRDQNRSEPRIMVALGLCPENACPFGKYMKPGELHPDPAFPLSLLPPHLSPRLTSSLKFTRHVRHELRIHDPRRQSLASGDIIRDPVSRVRRSMPS